MTRLGTLVAKAVGVLFSVAGGMSPNIDCALCVVVLKEVELSFAQVFLSVRRVL